MSAEQWFVLESDGSGLAVAAFEVKWYGTSFFSVVETVTKKRAL